MGSERTSGARISPGRESRATWRSVRSSKGPASGRLSSCSTRFALRRRSETLKARESGAKVGRHVFENVGAGTRRSMQANKRRDTRPELAIRRLLHRAGARYRVDL